MIKFPIGDCVAGVTLHARPQGAWKWQRRGQCRIGFARTEKALNDLRYKDCLSVRIRECALDVTPKSKYYYYNAMTQQLLNDLWRNAAETMANMI